MYSGGVGWGYRGVWTSVDATAFVSKKRFLGNNISCCECTTNNQTSLVFLCIMYSIYRFVFIYIYMYIHISILEKEIAAGPLRPHQRHALRSHADRAPRPLVRYESTTFHIQSCPHLHLFQTNLKGSTSRSLLHHLPCIRGQGGMAEGVRR